jgi:CRP-like cAMP-binding protein
VLTLSTRLETVHQAVTPGQREAIYRFRYAILVGKRRHTTLPGVDHERRIWQTPGDEDPSTRQLFTGQPEQLDAAARWRRWAPGMLPDDVCERYSLGLVDTIDELAVAEVSRIVASPHAPPNRRLAILALFQACFEACLDPSSGADLLVFEVHPGLVREVAKLFGARRYGAALRQRSSGVLVPMLIVVSDLAQFERAGSLFTPLAWKTFVLGRRARVELGGLAARFIDDLDAGVEPERSWPVAEARFFRRAVARSSLFTGLRPGIVDELMARGRIRELDEGQHLVHEHEDLNEMYVVLAGCFEIFAKRKSVDVAGEGEIIGELAVLSPETRRRALGVVALTPARVLSLSPSALRSLALGDPEGGYQVMFNLARITAERFGETSRLVGRLDAELERLTPRPG